MYKKVGLSVIDINLKNDLLKMIDKRCSYEKARKILVDFKILGGKQDIAYNTLEDIRLEFIKNNEEEKENFLLDLMDIVVGWCHPNVKIWDDDLKT